MLNPDILIVVEDDEASRLYMQMVLDHSDINCPKHFVGSKDQAIRLIKELNGKKRILSFIDLHLMDSDAFDILDELNNSSFYGNHEHDVVLLSSMFLDKDLNKMVLYNEIIKHYEKPLVLSMINELSEEKETL